MGWIGDGSIKKYNTKEDVLNEWDSVWNDIPNRVDGINELMFLGTFASQEAAERALKGEKRYYGMIYAKVERPHKESAALTKLRARLRREEAKLTCFIKSSSVYETHSGKTVGCKRCGSSFPVDYFKENSRYLYNGKMGRGSWEMRGRDVYVNTCPICGADMRSETALKRINGYRANISAYKDAVCEAEKKEEIDKYTCYLGAVSVYVG